MGVMYLDEYYFIKCEMVDNVLNSQLEEDTTGVQVTLTNTIKTSLNITFAKIVISFDIRLAQVIYILL